MLNSFRNYDKHDWNLITSMKLIFLHENFNAYYFVVHEWNQGWSLHQFKKIDDGCQKFGKTNNNLIYVDHV
jgi:hypothetical protein